MLRTGNRTSIVIVAINNSLAALNLVACNRKLETGLSESNNGVDSGHRLKEPSLSWLPTN